MSAEGRIFYQYGSYSLTVAEADADTVEQIVRRLKGVVQFRNMRYGG